MFLIDPSTIWTFASTIRDCQTHTCFCPTHKETSCPVLSLPHLLHISSIFLERTYVNTIFFAVWQHRITSVCFWECTTEVWELSRWMGKGCNLEETVFSLILMQGQWRQQDGRLWGLHRCCPRSSTSNFPNQKQMEFEEFNHRPWLFLSGSRKWWETELQS